MARLRYNKLETTLGAELDDTSTSVTFAVKLTAADGDIPTIASPDYLPLVIDSEIVHLTAYTSEATSGTITRAEEGTTAATHTNGTAVRNASTAEDLNIVINTDGNPGRKIYVGTVDPDTLYTLELGDVWIEEF